MRTYIVHDGFARLSVDCEQTFEARLSSGGFRHNQMREPRHARENVMSDAQRHHASERAFMAEAGKDGGLDPHQNGFSIQLLTPCLSGKNRRMAGFGPTLLKY
jgi:hypothetical protein